MSFEPSLTETIDEPSSSIECADVTEDLLAKFADGELLRLVARAVAEYLPEFVAWFACRHCQVLSPTEPDPQLLRRASTPVQGDQGPRWSPQVQCVCSFSKLDQLQIIGSACIYELSAQTDLMDRLERLLADAGIQSMQFGTKALLDELSGFMGPLIRAKYKTIVQMMIEEELEGELALAELQSSTEAEAEGRRTAETDTDAKSEPGDYYSDSDEDDPTKPYPIPCSAMLERWSEPSKHVALTDLMTRRVPKYVKHFWWHLKPSDQEKILQVFAETGADYVMDFVDTFGCRHGIGIEKDRNGCLQWHRRPETPFPYDTEGCAKAAPPLNCYCTAAGLSKVQTFGRSAILELSANPQLPDKLACHTQDVQTKEALQHLGLLTIRHVLRWLSLDIQHRMEEVEIAKLERASELQKEWNAGGWKPEQVAPPPDLDSGNLGSECWEDSTGQKWRGDMKVDSEGNIQWAECWGDSSLTKWLRDVKPEYGLGEEEQDGQTETELV